MPMTQDLEKVQRTRGHLASIKVYLSGEKARLDAAVAAVQASGVTAEQLAPIRAAIDEQVREADAIAAAITANPEPGPGVPPVTPVP